MLLTLFSTYAGLGDIAYGAFVAVCRHDGPALMRVAGDFVRLVAKAIALSFASGVIERAVSLSFFLLISKKIG